MLYARHLLQDVSSIFVIQGTVGDNVIFWYLEALRVVLSASRWFVQKLQVVLPVH